MPKTLQDVSKIEFIEENSNQPPPPPLPPRTRTSYTSRAVNISQLPEQLREIEELRSRNKPKSAVKSKIKSPVNDRPRTASSVSASPRPSGNNIPQPFSPKADALIKWIHGVIGSTKTKAQLKEHVARAIRGQKVFSIFGTCEPIHHALLSRGWVEKPTVEISWQLHNSKPFEGRNDTAILKNYYDRADFIHSTLKACTANLIWNASLRLINWREIEDNQMVNQSPGAKAAFCSKMGIADCVLDSHWFRNPETVDLKFPRCYRLDSEEEKSVFINDFRLTACVALLQWLVNNFDHHGLGGVVSITNAGKTKWWSVEFAINQIEHYSKVRQNEDLDGDLEQPTNYVTHWDNFIQQYNKIVLDKLKLPSDMKLKEAKEIVEQAKIALQYMLPYWTTMNVDGSSNVWICKPSYGSRGLGIIVSNRLEEIFALQKPKAAATTATAMPILPVYDGKNVIVQKYIEKPFLIFKTKFDIRQWFFVSCWNPLSVWFYKDCYLRFCSAPFDLERFHPKIHLCNTAVQRRYQVANKYRDSNLPVDNVWELSTFKKYLKNLGKDDVWESIISPGMKQSLLSVLLPSQKILLDGSTKKIRQNSFEIYGADFLLSEDFTPWLLEVNFAPLMQDTSSKIMKLSRQCLDDCIKVVIDRRIDPEAPTGKFELVYQQFQPLDIYMQAQKGNIVVLGKSFANGKRDGSKSMSPSFKAKKSSKKKSPQKKRNYMEENTVNAEADNSSLSAVRLGKALRRFLQGRPSQEQLDSEGKEIKLEMKPSSRSGLKNMEKNVLDSWENILIPRSSTDNHNISRSRSLSELSMENNLSTPNLRPSAAASDSITRHAATKKAIDGPAPALI